MKEAGLYVHIPFCVKKCDYCDFFSSPASSVPDSYVEAVLRELEYRVNYCKVTNWRTVYVGGGTPSLLSAQQISRLLNGIFSIADGSNVLEVTWEMNPETVTQEKLMVLEECGVTRISLGVQSLNDGALRAVGRHCTREACLSGLEKIKKWWKKDFNLDAIAGLPGQTTEEFISSLREIVSYEPSHLSMYTLTVEEGTPLYEKIQDGLEIDGDLSDAQWISGKEVLRNAGYIEYEVSNFAKPGKESRHNMLYWQQMDYVGVGSGGCGTVYSLDTFFTGERWTNSESITDYMLFWLGQSDWSQVDHSKIPQETELLDEETLEYEFLMMGLRTTKGVSVREYERRFARTDPWKGSLKDRLEGAEGSKVWLEFKKKQRIIHYKEPIEGTFYALTEEGLLFLNTLLLDL